MKRPKLVWAIIAYYIVSVSASFLGWAALYAGVVKMTPAELAFYAGLSIFDYLVTLSLCLVTLFAVYFLYGMRAVSVTLFTIALGINLAYSIWPVKVQG
jgi:hypothetical protein